MGVREGVREGVGVRVKWGLGKKGKLGKRG